MNQDQYLTTTDCKYNLGLDCKYNPEPLDCKYNQGLNWVSQDHLQYKGKCVWPEMMDSHYLVAVQLIQREAPWAFIQIVPEAQLTDACAKKCFKRVLIPVNSTGHVSKIPYRG